MDKSITIILPAYNEEKNLIRALKKYDRAVSSIFNDYEFLIFNDGSTDRTGEIANEIALKNKRVRAIHNKQNMGVGYSFREGVKISQKDYYMYIPAEGEILETSVQEILSHIGKADIVIPYVKNSEVRKLHRKIISRGFTALLNVLFGLHLKYYNGSVVYKNRMLKGIKMTVNGFEYQAEILIKMLKRGYSYVEVPEYIMKTQGSEIFKISNILKSLIVIFKLWIEVMVYGEY